MSKTKIGQLEFIIYFLAKTGIYVYNCFNNLIAEANAALFASVGLMMSYYLQKQEKIL